MREAGKLDAEGFSQGGDEIAPNAAARHAGPLVAFAEAHPDAIGSKPIRDYITLQASNPYRQYRTRAMEAILRAVIEHRDGQWIGDLLPLLAAGVLAGGSPEFGDAVRAAICAQRDPASFGALEKQLRGAAAALRGTRSGGDLWGGHRHALSALAECKRIVFSEPAAALELIEEAQRLPYGYAGFGYAAQLRIAEATMICTGPTAPEIRPRLDDARRAANNVVDLILCATLRSRVDAIDALMSDPAFDVRSPADMEHSIHHVGARYEHRTLPDPCAPDQPQSLADVARMFELDLQHLGRANPSFTPDAMLPVGTLVRVPDAGFAPVLAAWISAVALADDKLFPDERIRIIQRLVPIALEDHASGDAVLARLVLALEPSSPLLGRIEAERRSCLERTVRTSLTSDEPVA
jgi:hypothetical protein